MQNWQSTLLHKANFTLGEGAFWHPRWKQFLYVDIEGKKIGSIDPLTKKLKEYSTKKMVGALLPADGEQLIMAAQGAIEMIEFTTGHTRELIKIETDKPDNRCNDGKCDVKGRLWIGTMHKNANANEGALYKYDGAGLTKMIDKTTVSNGLCWSPDNSVLYYIDSFDYNIKAFDFDAANGTITNERIAVNIEGENLVPDGMCADAEGMLWVAIWGGGAVHRYNPQNGQLLGKVFVDAPHVTNCAFGGNNMQQLFITTATSGLSDAQREQFPLSGSLFIADTGISGLAAYPFKPVKYS